MPNFLSSDQTNRSDSPGHAPEKMIWGQLRPHIVMPKLLKQAFARVSRPAFVPPCYQECCYHDDPIPLNEKGNKQRFLLAPLTVAKLLVHVDFETIMDKKVLILGGGTGYSTALLGQMDIDCIMIESCPELAAQATENLMSYPKVVVKSAPLDSIDNVVSEDSFDIIFIDGGAAESIPQSLLNKLTPTGFLLALQQQTISSSAELSLCRGVKILATGNKSILFDAWVPVNQDFSTSIAFSF